MHITDSISRRTASIRTAAITVLLCVTTLPVNAPAADAAIGGNAAWGASATCWAGQFDTTLLAQGEYDGQWVAVRRYIGVWNAQQRGWNGQSSSWIVQRDPAGPGAAVNSSQQVKMPAGVALQVWYQVAFYGAAGWSVLEWMQAGHTSHRWAADGSVSTVRNDYCMVS
jgi:hypothetical protein